MCARYSITKDGLTIRIGEIEVVIHFGPRYNLSPSQKEPRPAIVLQQDKPTVLPMFWGWPVPGQKDRINAKTESIHAGLYPPDRFHRCLIPADGFYEWTDRPQRKGDAPPIPIRFTKPRDEPFCFAGIFKIREHKSAHDQESDAVITTAHFALVTTVPDEHFKSFHQRMPVILQPHHYHRWLGYYNPGYTGYLDALAEPDTADLEHVQVQPALNHTDSEGPHLIRPYFPPQGKLF